MNEHELKEFFKATFNTVANGYDNSAMRFFPDNAKHIASCLNLRGDELVLDVATGTGVVALTVAPYLPKGHVTGIDFSKGMLSQAKRKKEEENVSNVTFTEMDMQDLEFPDNHFDIAISAFSIFFVEDMEKQLAHITKKVKHGGKIITSTFFDTAFSPLVILLLNRLESYGVEVPSLAWKRVATKEQCRFIFETANLHDIQCEQVECGYYLKNASDWWYIVWNAGFRGLVNQLSPTDLESFKKEHFAEIEQLASAQGIWLEMIILYTFGTKIKSLK